MAGDVGSPVVDPVENPIEGACGRAAGILQLVALCRRSLSPMATSRHDRSLKRFS